MSLVNFLITEKPLLSGILAGILLSLFVLLIVKFFRKKQSVVDYTNENSLSPEKLSALESNQKTKEPGILQDTLSGLALFTQCIVGLLTILLTPTIAPHFLECKHKEQISKCKDNQCDALCGFVVWGVILSIASLIFVILAFTSVAEKIPAPIFWIALPVLVINFIGLMRLCGLQQRLVKPNN